MSLGQRTACGAIEAMLSGGERRMIGRAGEAAALAMEDAAFREALVAALDSGDALVRMRGADAPEKVDRLLDEASRSLSKAVRTRARLIREADRGRQKAAP